MSLLRNSLRSALMANNLKRIRFTRFFAVQEESFFHGTAHQRWVSAPPELKNGNSAAARTAALIEWRCFPRERGGVGVLPTELFRLRMFAVLSSIALSLLSPLTGASAK